MNKKLSFILGFGILFLLFVQSIATFIEGIYILELLSTSLDEKVLGILFLFSPILLLPFGKRVPRWFMWVTFCRNHLLATLIRSCLRCLPLNWILTVWQ